MVKLDQEKLRRNKEDELLWKEAYNKGMEECAEEKIRNYAGELKKIFDQFDMWQKDHIICIINEVAKKEIKKENGN